MNECILCGNRLDDGQPVNREHYVPHVLIRNFSKLMVPEKFSHALRVDMRPENDAEGVLAPRSAHREWATIKVHQRCNLDASPMCQDLKRIIDNLDNRSAHRYDRIREYYADLWGNGLKPENIGVLIFSPEQLIEIYKSGKPAVIYRVGSLWTGRLLVQAVKTEILEKDYHKYTTFMGSSKSLEQVIRSIENDEEPDVIDIR